jgi:hypothetical protein
LVTSQAPPNVTAAGSLAVAAAGPPPDTVTRLIDGDGASANLMEHPFSASVRNDPRCRALLQRVKMAE